MFAKFSIYQTRIESGEIEFMVADMMSLPLEELIPGNLPVILYLGHEEGQEDKATIGIYYFDRNRFGRMVQLAINKPQIHIENEQEFMNLLSIELEL